MKKILLFCLASGTLTFGYIPLQAQNLVSSGATLTVSGSNTTLLEANVDIVNSGSSDVYVKVHRTGSSLVPGHSTYFCWNTCYVPSVATSADSVRLRPTDTTSAFHGYVDPGGVNGTSTVSYRFYDVANLSDYVDLTFTYNFSPTGINELSTKATVTNAYPNPADGLTSMSYNLNSSKDARLIFYNILGSAVKEIKLNEKESTLIIPTSDLKSGVYFYSLIADGKTVSTKKLVVAHR